MSLGNSNAIAATDWLTAEEMESDGYRRVRPETDYGVRWGDNERVRVSFAPYPDRPDGFVYAFDADAERYLLLAARATQREVDAIWRELLTVADDPDAYLAFRVLAHPHLVRDQAHDLLLDCFERESVACATFEAASASERHEAAGAVVVARAARIGAENIALQSAAAEAANPVVIRYRVLDHSDWAGRVADSTVSEASAHMRELAIAARNAGFEVQPTSVAQGRTTISAARVREVAAIGTYRSCGLVIDL